MAQLGDRTWYEWDIETIDKRDNIEDHDFDDRLADLAPRHKYDPDGPACFLVLVRNWGNEHDGLLNRQWAYVTRSGELPNEFDGGDKVPQKFKTELRKHRSWAANL